MAAILYRSQYVENYLHCSCKVVFWYDFVKLDFAYILQDHFTGTKAIVKWKELWELLVAKLYDSYEDWYSDKTTNRKGTYCMRENIVVSANDTHTVRKPFDINLFQGLLIIWWTDHLTNINTWEVCPVLVLSKHCFHHELGHIRVTTSHKNGCNHPVFYKLCQNQNPPKGEFGL